MFSRSMSREKIGFPMEVHNQSSLSKVTFRTGQSEPEARKRPCQNPQLVLFGEGASWSLCILGGQWTGAQIGFDSVLSCWKLSLQFLRISRQKRTILAAQIEAVWWSASSDYDSSRRYQHSLLWCSGACWLVNKAILLVSIILLSPIPPRASFILLFNQPLLLPRVIFASDRAMIEWGWLRGEHCSPGGHRSWVRARLVPHLSNHCKRGGNGPGKCLGLSIGTLSGSIQTTQPLIVKNWHSLW